MKKIFTILFLCFSLLAFAKDYPTKTVNGVSYYVYTVEKGDGVYGIGRKFDLPAKLIFEANPELTSETLTIGQKILVPTERPKSAIPKNCVPYKVKAGETLYYITHHFEVTSDELMKVNPELVHGLKSGMILYIPAKLQPELLLKDSTMGQGTNLNSPPKPTLDPVTPKDTSAQKEVTTLPPSKATALDTASHISVVSSKQTSVLVQTKLQQIPLLAYLSEEKGDVVRHEVKRFETMYHLCKVNQITPEDLVLVNPILNEGLQKGQIIYLPINHEVVLRALEAQKKAQTSTQVVEAEQKNAEVTLSNPDVLVPMQVKTGELKVAVLLPFNTKIKNLDGSADRFIEFYKGLLLSSDRIRQSGKSIDLHVYDIDKDSLTLDSVLHLPEMLQMDWIIGPAYSTQIGQVTRFAALNHIWTLIPFSNHLSDCNYHPYVLQFNPCYDAFYANFVTSFIDSNNYQYIIGDVEGANDRGSAYANAFATSLDRRKMSYTRLELNKDNIDTIKSLVNERTLLILGSSQMEVVRPLLDSLHYYQLDDVTLFGHKDWGKALSIFPRVYYTALFYETNPSAYTAAYNRWYGQARSTTNGIRYDMLGYDCLQYLAACINGVFMPNVAQYTPHYILTAPHFMNTGENSFVNYGAFLFIRHGEDIQHQSF